jgi:UPF0755 protein
MSETRREARAKTSKRGCGVIAAVLVVILAIGGGGAWFAWTNYETKIREVLGLPADNDFTGTGKAPEVQIIVEQGEYGDAIAQKLVDAGVTKSFDAVYQLLLADSSIVFTPGSYTLKTEMSAASAVAVLSDPANRITLKVTIPEGSVLTTTLAALSEATGIPVSEFETAIGDPTVFGIPAKAPSVEGFLFPATYEFNPTQDATSIIQTMVDEMNARLDALGVEPSKRYSVVTFAALVQREAGSDPRDFAKIARVFQNRLDAGWKMESDATVAYGTGNLHTVWTTDEERADASNLYNTYVHNGLPVGPIGLPGEVALKAVLKPKPGPWFFFVPVNLKTGETRFSETSAQHGAAVQELRAWCNASTANAAYCD